MRRCIFCQQPIGSRSTSEHILLNAFGGKVTTRKLSCAPCNNRLGGTIDRELAEQFASVRNLFEMVSGDGKDAPSLMKVQAGNRKVNLRGNGDITLAGKPFVVEEIADGQYRLEIEVTSLDQLESLIPHIVAKTGISEVKLREQLASAPFTDTQERPGTVDFHLSLGGEEVMRAVTKACMLLWARKIGNEELQKPEYDEARRFVVNGGAHFLSSKTCLDSRPMPHLVELQAAYGPLFNLIHVAGDATGRVVGHFTVYNLLGFQIVLAESEGFPQATAALANDPLDPKIWSDRADEMAKLDIAWLNAPHLETEVYRSRFVRMMEAYYDVIGKRAQIRIMDRVFARYGIAENDPIPPELIKPIADEIGTRLAYNAFGIPVTVPVPAEQIAERLRPPSTD